MSRGASQSSPSAEQRDLHDLVRILNRIKGNRVRSKAVNDLLLFHAKALLKLFADDDNYGALDPEALEREAQAAEAKKARSDALEEVVRKREEPTTTEIVTNGEGYEEERTHV